MTKEQQPVKQETEQATNQAQTAVNGEQKAKVEVPPQYKLNQFYANLRHLNKNIIRVANVQLNPQEHGAFVGSPVDFWNVFARSQATDLLVAFRTFGQIKPEIAEKITDVTDPNAITDIRVAFAVGNQTVTASYTLLNVHEAFEKYYKESVAAQEPGAPEAAQIDDSKVLEKAS